jgi:hypothetical protein
MSTETTDPFAVLGVKPDATEAEVRARYLALVKRFPPEQSPDEFRRVHTAYESVKDPLTLARQLAVPPGEQPPGWSDVIEQQKEQPPPLTPSLVLSLGNRDASNPKGNLRFDPPHE